MKLKFILFPLLTLLLLSACGAAAPSGDPLEGTSWQLTSYRKTRPVEGSIITIEFKEGQAGGSAGCNGYGGRYEVDGNEIAFQELASTLMLCTAPEGVMEQEAEFLGSLEQVERFELTEGQLQLIRADGEALVFVPVL